MTANPPLRPTARRAAIIALISSLALTALPFGGGLRAQLKYLNRSAS